jgi:hypothetical protein
MSETGHLGRFDRTEVSTPVNGHPQDRRVCLKRCQKRSCVSGQSQLRHLEHLSLPIHREIRRYDRYMEK